MVNNTDTEERNDDTAATADVVVWRPDSWLLWFCVILIVLSNLVCLVSLLLMYVYRTKPIITLGQPPFLYQLAIGGILLASCSIFGIVIPTFFGGTTATPFLNTCCMLYLWLGWSGYQIMGTVLFIKTYRTYKVTRFIRGQKFLPRNFIVPYAILVGTSFVLLVSRSIFYRSQYVVVPEPFDAIFDDDNNDNTNYVRGVCLRPEGSDKHFYTGHQYALTVLYFLIQILILFWAYRIRTIHEEIGDSRAIFIVISFFTVVYATNFIVLNIVDGGLRNNARYFVLSSTLLTVQYTLDPIVAVGLLIGRRIYLVWYPADGLFASNYGSGRVVVAGNITAIADATADATIDIDRLESRKTHQIGIE